MNLKQRKEEYMGELGRGKRKEETLQLNFLTKRCPKLANIPSLLKDNCLEKSDD